MANLQSSNKTAATRRSGISKLPQVLPYPKPLSLQEAPQIKGVYSYIMPHYGHKGICVLIYREPQKDSGSVICADWSGNLLDIKESTNPLEAEAYKFIGHDLQKFLKVMHVIRLTQAQFFIAIDNDGPLLTDVQVSLNKLVGPGMVTELFGKIYRTPEIRKIAVIDDTAMQCIEANTGSYSGNIILKPSVFRQIQVGPKLRPLHVEVKR